MTYDAATRKWFKRHPFVETTVIQCAICGLAYKPLLGHTCKQKEEAEAALKMREEADNEVRDMIDLVPTIGFPPNAPRTLEELREIVKQLEWCGYECEGGSLSMSKTFIRLKELAYRRKPYPNPPLTLEQLREMEGEPVWIAPVKENGKVPARWMLVSGYNVNKDIYLFAPSCNITQGYDGKSYGKTWLAYRWLGVEQRRNSP